jgi:hypothetical protein
MYISPLGAWELIKSRDKYQNYDKGYIDPWNHQS